MGTVGTTGITQQLQDRIHTQPFEEPIRDQIFSSDRLQQFGKYLARQIPITKKVTEGKSLLPRVADNEKNLVAAYKIFSESVEKGHTLPPAAEWLIDNFHIIEDQVREIQEDLPEKFYVELPKLSVGELANYPRVYAIALSVIAHTDSHIDCETLKRFIREFQTESPLTIGEIWAIAIVLRIALVENLRRIIMHVLYTHEIAESSNRLADSVLEKVGKSDDENFSDELSVIAKFLGQSEVADSSITLQLLRRLRDQHISVRCICDKLDAHLSEKNKTFESVLQSEHQFQASAQVTVGNIVTSMRLISNIDWDDFFESVNLIDPILAQDPAGAYSKMDFSSRDRYRHVIERIAKRTEISEQTVAEACVTLAAASLSAHPAEIAKSHVGYYLLEDGVTELEKLFGYRLHPRELFQRILNQQATYFYFGTLFLLLSVAALPLVWYLNYLGSDTYDYVLVFFAAFFPLVDSCLAVVNLLITRTVPPRVLAKIDLNGGIPTEAQTFVVIPTLFANLSAVTKMIDFLETRYLSNPDENLYFAILSDYRDAAHKIEPQDFAIVGLAKEKIAELNERYPNTITSEDRFYLFHRERLWNKAENKWIGWERKRGKLHQFNQFLRGTVSTEFIAAPVFSSFFLKTQYVITLDSDTHLPRGSAKKLIGTILHPLNRPQLNANRDQVIAGYGILQPRISMTPESSGRSYFSRIFSGNTGIDPYTKAVSDVYQDLFKEGSFTGKGLYAVDAFEASMANRIPENSLLSHDLLEGLFCRTALVTDIEFLDDYPIHYEVFAKRQHRWTRGDWQLLPWLPQKSLSVISHWKIVDNLRRSLVAPFILLWLILGWTVLPGAAEVWTLAVLFCLALPSYAHATNSFLFHSGDIPWTSHFWNIWGDFKTNTVQIALHMACLLHQSYLQTDAIVRTLFRIGITKKNRLQWVSAADEESRLSKRGYFSKNILLTSFAMVTAICILVFFTRLQSFYAAGVFLLIWSLFPVLAEQISHVRKEVIHQLSDSDENLLRKIARKTWNFYENFVGEKDNWLIPDNFQEEPKPVIAHRTSPTNIGLLLLSTCSAYDFGYITAAELAERLEKTFSSLKKLEQFKGHFYNWYDTQSLAPLHPKYVSTVDSGNLAGHLLAVKQTCLEVASKLSFTANSWVGLADTILVLQEKLNLTYGPSVRLEALLTLIRKNGSLQIIRSEFITFHNSLKADVATLGWSDKFLKMLQQLEKFEERKGERDFVSDLSARLYQLAETAQDVFTTMEFDFLFDEQRKVFTIGYNVSDGRLDNAFYDLLASESRLTSFIAISKGNVPQSHWFHLGRQMTLLSQRRSLVSWSASMFEYLMPLLVMKNYNESLLHETHLSVIQQQKDYGDKMGIPWGISESGYNARDLQQNYQYGPFGVPGLGLKRGLKDDLVISPYSTFLAIVVSAGTAIKNIKRLIQDELLTDFGFYEAVDYTKNRLPPQQSRAVIKSFMAHHQGMIFVSLDNFLHHGIMQKRFHQDEIIRGSDLLLQERVPRKVVMSQLRAEELHSDENFLSKTKSALRAIPDVRTLNPVTQVLSNGKFTVLLTAAGSGFSRFENMAITRWHEDATRDAAGTFFFLHDHASHATWSATKQPFSGGGGGGGARNYSALFSEHKAEFRCENDICGTLTEVVVSAEDDAEIRRITLTNLTDQKRSIEITSYLEPLLTSHAADLAHPAFSNLFIETEFITPKDALLVHRRKRSASEADHWGFHLVTLDWQELDPNNKTQFETSRAQFIGRGYDITNPEVIAKRKSLSNTTGFVLDPCLSLRKKIILPPNSSLKLSFATGVANSREEALRLVDKYHDPHAFMREEEMAWTREQMDLRHLNIDAQEAEIFQTLCGALLFSNKLARAKEEILQANSRSQSALWTYGISGDLPVMVVTVSRVRDMGLIKQLLRFHSRLRMKSIAFDLVLISQENSGYRLDLFEEILQQVRSAGEGHWLNKHGGVFILRRDMLPDQDWTLLQSIARIYFEADQFSLKEVAQRLKSNKRAQRVQQPAVVANSPNWIHHSLKIPEMHFFNGLGGFSRDGRQYLIHLTKSKATPLPWINVVANSKEFGFLISESGSSYTWSANSRENRLTPWNNDQVSDAPSEVIYIQDKITKQLWSPTPALKNQDLDYLVTHGQGFTAFDHINYEIETKLTMFVPLNDEVKITKLRFKNRSQQKRTLEVTSYVEWVLGLHKSKTAHTVITKRGPQPNSFLAQNPFSIEFANRVAYAAVSESVTSFTCDRRSFLGRHGHFKNPIGLQNEKLGGEIGAGFDACVAIKCEITLAANEEKEIVFLLGQSDGEVEVNLQLQKFILKERVESSLTEVQDFWQKSLTQLTVKTPFPEMDVLANSWLLYQTLACRVWARSGFYQSGGAFGYRDQLQDAMALVYIDPKLSKQIICNAAAHQFKEGDVLHWWHPPKSKGVRTHFSDDLLWLPYVVSFYIDATGDTDILNTQIQFLEADAIPEDREDIYMEPRKSLEVASIFEHCARAIDRSLKVGQHGIPLIGSGDWNDGMNRVGHAGKGESVWMAWFLGSVLEKFMPYCEANKAEKRLEIYKAHLANLKVAVETEAWDGEWYARAFYDDGSLLGSSQNEECKIDSLVQSWAAISKLGNSERTRQAMQAVDHHLVNRSAQLIRLFTPAFDKTPKDPGYIKGYLPGVRENGGQYTHAAIWVSIANAAIGEGDKAIELLRMLNPLLHSQNLDEVQKYKVEPYVITADVYAVEPYIGRGGWSWYTGSSGWYYRAFIESILGIHLRGSSLMFQPCQAISLPRFEAVYKYGSSVYQIMFENNVGANLENAPRKIKVSVNGAEQKGNSLKLIDDGQTYQVNVLLTELNNSPEVATDFFQK